MTRKFLLFPHNIINGNKKRKGAKKIETPALSLSLTEDGVLLMTAEVLLPPTPPPAVEKRLLLQCESLKQRLSESVFPLLRKSYGDSSDKRKRITWSPFRLSVSLREISRTSAFVVYLKTVAVFRKGKRLYFQKKTELRCIKDGKYIPEKKLKREKRKPKKTSKSKEKAKKS